MAGEGGVAAYGGPIVALGAGGALTGAIARGVRPQATGGTHGGGSHKRVAPRCTLVAATGKVGGPFHGAIATGWAGPPTHWEGPGGATLECPCWAGYAAGGGGGTWVGLQSTRGAGILPGRLGPNEPRGRAQGDPLCVRGAPGVVQGVRVIGIVGAIHGGKGAVLVPPAIITRNAWAIPLGETAAQPTTPGPCRAS